MKNILTRPVCLADYCENYIDNCLEDNLNEKIYTFSCDYLRGVLSKQKESILRKFFNI